MGASYGVKCLDCPKHDYIYQISNNYGDFTDVVKDWPKLKKAWEALLDLGGWCFSYEIKISGMDYDTSIQDIYTFFNLHYGHNLICLRDGHPDNEPIKDYEPSIKPMGEIIFDLQNERLTIEVPKDRYQQLIYLLKIT